MNKDLQYRVQKFNKLQNRSLQSLLKNARRAQNTTTVLLNQLQYSYGDVEDMKSI